MDNAPAVTPICESSLEAIDDCVTALDCQNLGAWLIGSPANPCVSEDRDVERSCDGEFEAVVVGEGEATPTPRPDAGVVTVSDASLVPDADAPDARAPECGDGLLEGAEACDDADLESGDGCNLDCTVEFGWACEGAPSVCGYDWSGTFTGTVSGSDNGRAFAHRFVLMSLGSVGAAHGFVLAVRAGQSEVAAGYLTAEGASADVTLTVSHHRPCSASFSGTGELSLEPSTVVLRGTYGGMSTCNGDYTATFTARRPQ